MNHEIKKSSDNDNDDKNMAILFLIGILIYAFFIIGLYIKGVL